MPPVLPPDPVPSPAALTPQAPFRERLATAALVLAALLLLAVAVFHFTGYFTASLAAQNSGLSPWFQQAFRALWLGFSLQGVVLGLVVLLAALRPRWVSPPVAVICGLLPVVNGILLFHFLASALGTSVLILTALLLVTGAALRPGR